MTESHRPLLLSLLLIAGPVAAQIAPQSAHPKSPPDSHQSLASKLLDFIGIPADSGALRGLGDSADPGEVWVTEITGGKSRQLTRTAEFRSPVFIPGGTDVLALRGSDVVRLSGPGDAPRKLATVKTAAKLVGCSAADPDKLLLVTTTAAGGDELSVLSLGSGQLSRVPFDPRNDKESMDYLDGWNRVYPSGSLYVQVHTQETLAGVVEWQDVFFQSGHGAATNVSRCEATDCGQPSLSFDARWVVFIKGAHR